MSDFHQNVDRLREKNPTAAFFIPREGARLENYPSNEDSDLSIEPKILENTDILFILGIGTGDFYLHYRSWLKEKKERAIVFIEKDESLLFHFLHLSIAETILEDPQVDFVLIKDDDLSLFNPIGWKYLFQTFHIVSLPYFQDVKKLRIHIEELINGIFLVASDYKEHGLDILQNIYRNFAHANDLSLVSKTNDFQDIPAIICGAGPSLEKQMPLLRKMHSHALIIAGGSAIDILDSESVPIHIGAAVDPSPDLNRFEKNRQYEMPFFYLNRLKHEVLALQQGPKFLIGTPGGYPIEEWMYHSLSIYLPLLDLGWDVSCFGVHLAYLLGCNPIIFVGMDHCGSKEKIYAKAKEQTVFNEQEWIHCKDMFGNEKITKKDWLLSVDWLSEFAKNHPERRFFNATEGGITIPGVFHIQFQTVQKEFLKYPKDLTGRFHAKAQLMEKIAISKESALETLEKISSSLNQLKQILREIIDQKLEKSPELFIKEAELESEIAYQYILDPLWSIWKYVFSRLHRLDSKKTREKKEKYHKMVFFQDIVNKHFKLIQSVCQKINTPSKTKP